MMAEIIPEGYDIYGKKTLRPKKRKRRCCRVFYPTFPMGRFVSKPLSVKCSNIQEVQQFLQGCTYVPDIEQFHKPDYWLPPEEFEKTRKGDCEDFALWTWRQMMMMGYPARFVVGRAGTYGAGHGWVTIEKDGKYFLVEPLVCWYGETFPKLSMLRYKPEISVEWDGKKIHYFSHEKRVYIPSLREGFVLWKEWLAYRIKRRGKFLKKRANVEGVKGLGSVFLRFWLYVFCVILRLLPWKSGKYLSLYYLAHRASKKNRYYECAKLSDELLRFAKRYPKDMNYGNAIHHGNILFGKLALKFGQIKEAKEHLIQAGKTQGSPRLNSFGPDMSLAKELLETGEEKVVIEYFKLCRKFWKMDNGRLELWTRLIKEGRIPDFGENLLS